MENSSPLILEISSDEEGGFGCSTRKGEGGGEFVDKEDCDWLSKLLGEVGGDKADDSDDVVFVSEVLPKPRKKSPAKGAADGGDDDDCVVLDGDPDKPVVMGKSASDDHGGDSDDLEIVGEKGEVACRDFPHPRHLCVKFPFASTRHEVHCLQCHCHVCDLVAPCSHWGTGVSSIDHCHANDKDEYWKAERKRMKKGDKLVPGIRGATGPLDAFIQTIQFPAIAPPQPNYLLQNPVLNPVKLHPCSTTPTVGVPNAENQGRIHPSRRFLSNYKPRPQLVSPQLHSTCSDNVASRDKSDNSGNRSVQSLRPRAVFKRTGLVGAPPNVNHAHRSHLSRDAILKICRASQTPMLNERHSSNQRNVRSRTVHSVLPEPSPQTMDVGRASYLPSRSHIPSRPWPRSLIRDPLHCQSQMPSQPYVSSNFVSEVPLQPQTASHPSVENFKSSVPHQPVVFQPLPSAKVAPYHEAGNAFYDQLHPRPVISSHLDVGNNFENQSPEPEPHTNSTSLLIDGPYDLQQGKRPQSGIDESPPEFGFAFDPPLRHGNLQIHDEVRRCQNVARADNSQQLGTGNNSHRQSIAPLVNFHQALLADDSSEVPPCQNIAPADNSQQLSRGNNSHRQSIAPLDNFPQALLADDSSVTNGNDNQFPGSMGPDSLDFQFDSWMFENHSPPGAFEIPLSPVWNAFSPEPASTDAAWSTQDGSYMAMKKSLMS